MRYYPAPHDRAGVEQWIERNRQRYRDDGVGLRAMELKQTEEMIGDCGTEGTNCRDPQGLKPSSLLALSGTAEAALFPIVIYEIASSYRT
jgi:RimJ/RimL family protein N-acetyltransferase